MVQVLDPLHSGQARGSYSGLTFMTSSGRHNIRLRVAPAQPRSSRQTNVRAILASISRSWQSITANQRTAWNAYAADHPVTDPFGKQIILSGMNWFVECNHRLTDMGQSTIEDPPTDPAPAILASLVGTPAANAITITWTPTGGTATQAEIFIVGPHSAGRQGRRERAVFKARANGEAGTITISSLSAGVYTFWARAASEATGLVSLEQKMTKTIPDA